MAISDLLRNDPKATVVASARRAAPKGWEPGIDTEKGVVVTVREDSAPPSDEDWAEVLQEMGLNPERWSIASDRVNVRAWDVNLGNGNVTRFFYFKADVRPRVTKDVPDIEAIARRIQKFKKSKVADAAATDLGGQGFLVCLADWQTGKGEGGGTEALLDRVERLIADVEVRVKELRKIGRQLDVLYVAGLGDLVEGCNGWYPMQLFSIDLDRRDQLKVVRRLITEALLRWSQLFKKVVVLCVPGNHGENRDDGQARTWFGDNDDVVVFEEVQDAFNLAKKVSDAFDHVSFHIPDDEWDVTVDICGTVTTFAHGHQFQKVKGGGSAIQDKAMQWWKNNQHNGRLAGESTLLISGHFHHWDSKGSGPKTWFQCPPLDGGSTWFERCGGDSSVAGTLTMVVGHGKFQDIAIL